MATNKSEKKKLVIVESPVKAKTIKKFLGSQYLVESCMGHVRDLPQSAKDIPAKYKKKSWAHLGVNVDEDFEPIYCVPKNKTKIVNDLKSKLDDVQELILATDEDREGESISWHLAELLKPKIPVKRMVFHEITKEAIEEALKNFRQIDQNLVRAQEARRILDRLVGYTLSPLIWKKVAYGLSGGRVQSVAVRLISERELERIAFSKATYWGLQAECHKDKLPFKAKCIRYDGKRIAIGKDFDRISGVLLPEQKREGVLVLDQNAAQKLSDELSDKDWIVTDVEKNPLARKPPAPFITSTLQQEANSRLGFTARRTMQVAQKLYEQGHITYMRTDSTMLSQQALTASRKAIESRFGSEYLPANPRTYEGKKVKGAQEAHEAIRPAGTQFLSAEELKLNSDEAGLYDLIWRRTLASQMKDSDQLQVRVTLEAGKGIFTASGMTIIFPGYLKAYVEELDGQESGLEERETHLPPLKPKDSVDCKTVQATDHETKPPARFTEASLIQTMEKEGIGRPSTYAVVIGTIIDRGYAKKAGNALVPTFTALVVSQLLSRHLPQYVDLKFTSEMEDHLDEIAQGDLEWTGYLKKIYFGKEGLKHQVEMQQKKINPDEARVIDLKKFDPLKFRVGRFGAYVCRRVDDDSEACASLPESYHPSDLTMDEANRLIDQKINGSDAIGKDPVSELPVYVLTGRYGPYVQLGDSAGEKEKPKRASVPATLKSEEVNLEKALYLLSLPRTLGTHPTSNEEIKLGLGRFGPYVVCQGDYRSLPKTIDFFAVTLNQALDLLAQPKRRRGQKALLRELGIHPDSNEKMELLDGKYGPYIKCGKTNVSLPEELKPSELTLEQALTLLANKINSKPAKRAADEKKAKAKTKTKPKSKPKKSDSKSDPKSSLTAKKGKKDKVLSEDIPKAKSTRSTVSKEAKRSADKSRQAI